MAKSCSLFVLSVLMLISCFNYSRAQEDIKTLFLKSLDTTDGVAKRQIREYIANTTPENQYTLVCKGWLTENNSEALTLYNRAIYNYPDFDYAYYYRGVLKSYYFDSINEAIIDFSRAIQLNPTEPYFFFERGFAYSLLSKHQEAIYDFNKAIELESKDISFYISRAKSYIAINKLTEAINDYTTTLNHNPQNDEVYYFRGKIFLTQNKFDDAISDFNNSIKNNSNNYKAFYKRGEAYYLKKMYVEALKDYVFVFNQEPENFDALYMKASSNYNLKNYEEAIKDYTKYLKIYPNDKDALISRSYSYYITEKYSSALNDCDSLIKENNTNFKYYYLRGLTYLKTQNYQKAILDFDKAIQLNPEENSIRYDRADAYYENQQFKEAFEEYNNLKKADPTFNIPIFSNIDYANKKFERKEYKLAIKYFNLAIVENKKYKTEKIYIKLADSKLNTGDTIGSIADYSTAIKMMNPKFTKVEEPLFKRGMIYYNSKKYVDAENDFLEGIQAVENRETKQEKNNAANSALFGKIQPQNTSLLYTYLGLSQIYQNKNDEGIANLNIACSQVQYFRNENKNKINLNDTLIYYLKGNICLNKLNKYELAIQSYDKIIEIIPDSSYNYMIRGFAKEKAGKKEEAILDFAFPLLISARKASAKFNKKIALSYYNQYLEKVKSNWEAFYERAEINFNNKDYNLALIDILNAIQLNQTDYNLRRFKISVLTANNNIEDVIIELTKIKSLKYTNGPSSISNNKIDLEIASLYEKINKFEKAIEIYDKFSFIEGYEYLASKKICECNYNLGKYDIATYYFDKAIKQSLTDNKNEHKSDHQLYYYNALSLYKKGQYITALSNLKTAIDISSNELYNKLFNEWSLDYLNQNKQPLTSNDTTILGSIVEIQALEKKKNEEEFYIIYKRQLTAALQLKNEMKFRDALTALNKLSETYKNFFEIYYWKSICNTKIQKYNEALTDINKSIELSKNNDSLFYLKGRVFFWLNNYQDAIIEYTKAIKINQKIYDYHYYRGIAYLESKNYSQALNDYNNAIKIDPYNGKAYSEIGFLYQQQNKYKEAINYMTEVISKFPNLTSAYIIRGWSYYLCQNYSSAFEDFTIVINNRDCSKNDLILAYLKRGICYYVMEEYSAAIKDFSQTLKADYNNSQALYYRALSYYYNEDYDQALTDFDKYNTIIPNNAKSYFYIGAILFDKNNYKSALTELNMAIKLDNSYGEAYLYRGMVYHNQNAGTIIGQDKYCTRACDDWKTARACGNKQADNYIDKYCR